MGSTMRRLSIGLWLGIPLGIGVFAPDLTAIAQQTGTEGNSDLDRIVLLASMKEHQPKVLTGTVLASETTARNKSGNLWPYCILTLKVKESIWGGVSDTLKVITPAHFYLEDGQVKEISWSGLGDMSRYERMAFVPGDQVLVVAHYLRGSSYEVDSSDNVWLAAFVSLTDSSFTILERQLGISVDKRKAETTPHKKQVLHLSLDFIERQIEATDVTLSEVRQALGKKLGESR